ncbi:MAG: agmatinase [Hyphomicrobiales bacterium]|nr:agmatinase [Hyphomicrobiales bacterium]OQW84146.1 MAG: agmatinase [Proteobacteria bacterium ST_bin15]
MDIDKLKRLRERYLTAKGGDMFDPHFAAIAEAQFKDGDKRKWPFADPATFLAAPLRASNDEASNIADVDIALIGVPMDLGVTNRAGARLGPRAVRGVERIGAYEPALKMAPLGEAVIADIGDVPMRSRFSLADCHNDIETFFARLAGHDIRPLAIGGDHSISLPILKALGAKRPLGLIHIDAHADTSGEYEGTKFHHGGPFRQAVLEGVLDPDRTIQIGIRGGAGWLWEFSHESGMTMIEMHEVAAIGLPAVIAKAREIAGSGPTYLTFDVDSLDPGFAPGTGTPEVGGFSPREVIEILRGLVGLDIVAGDVVEVAPQYDATTNTAHAAAQMAFEILCLMLRAPSFQRKV